MQHVCVQYNISPLDMQIADTITPEEFATLVDSSLEICEKYKKQDYGLFAKALAPIKGDTTFQVVACYLIVAIGILYFTLPVISIAVFGLMITQVYGMYKDLDQLKIAVALMTQMDYNRFVQDELLVAPEPPDLTVFDTQMLAELEQVKDSSEERNNATTSETVNAMRDMVNKECADLTNEIVSEYAAVKTAMNERLVEVHAKIEAYMKDYKPFPTVCNDSVVMSHDYTLGRIEDRLDVQATLPLSNIVFDCTNKERALDMMKLYLCNALLSVKG